jgi:ribosomal protein S18 acetylase RimI-like enzyme
MTEDKVRPKRIRVSGLQETQLAAVAEVEQAATAMYHDAGFDAAEVPARSMTEIVTLTRDHNVRVAEADYMVAGYAAWRDEAPGVGYIEDISVHPGFQRVGVGAKLLETIRDEAREAGIKQLVVKCWSKAPWALEFYKRMGFTEIAEGAPAKVAQWKEQRSSSGRPFTRPGEIAMWTAIPEAPVVADDEDEQLAETD